MHALRAAAEASSNVAAVRVTVQLLGIHDPITPSQTGYLPLQHVTDEDCCAGRGGSGGKGAGRVVDPRLTEHSALVIVLLFVRLSQHVTVGDGTPRAGGCGVGVGVGVGVGAGKGAICSFGVEAGAAGLVSDHPAPVQCACAAASAALCVDAVRVTVLLVS